MIAKKKEILQIAALCHDLSKFKCKSFYDGKGNPTNEAHFYNHEHVSAYDYLCAEAPWANKNEVILISNLIANHMVFYAGENAIKNRKKIYDDRFWEMLEVLHEADLRSH